MAETGKQMTDGREASRDRTWKPLRVFLRLKLKRAFLVGSSQNRPHGLGISSTTHTHTHERSEEGEGAALVMRTSVVD